MIGEIVNGRLYETTLPAPGADFQELAWVTIDAGQSPVFESSHSYTDADNYSFTGSGSLALLNGACYRENTLTPLRYTLELAVTMSSSDTGWVGDDLNVVPEPDSGGPYYPPESYPGRCVLGGSTTDVRSARRDSERVREIALNLAPPNASARNVYELKDNLSQQMVATRTFILTEYSCYDGAYSGTLVDEPAGGVEIETTTTAVDTSAERRAGIPASSRSTAAGLWAELGGRRSHAGTWTTDADVVLIDGDKTLISDTLLSGYAPTSLVGNLPSLFLSAPHASAAADTMLRQGFLTSVFQVCQSAPIQAVVARASSGHLFAQLVDPAASGGDGLRRLAIDGNSINPSSLAEVWGGAPITPYPCLWSAVRWPDIPTYDPPERASVQDLLDAHNAIRKERGLSEMTLNDDLSAAAALHGAWMEETGIFSHTGRDESDALDRARAAGYRGETQTSVGENLAGGYDTVEAVMLGWEGSPDHWENIIDPKWDEFGAFIWPSSHWSPFMWVVLFGKRS